ncbi:MAG: sugar ABC transporter permease [Bosea sp.]|uniref:carbohydrate ABC transporter permease n=1 Tax=Bosea sp. (in: a-proteobacteria) TaxID=1871050 RepID=UPI001AC0145C|nr:sugar ABC transporter permease [Bosea sp. (in: a-proteobacteria)]MBN9450327.1 sugar ABC transporter permease [Bosea sp. (in: a-proteobacteria)]
MTEAAASDDFHIPPRPPSRWEYISNDVRTLAVLFLLPTIVVLVSVVLYPFIYALVLSFQDKRPGIPARFIGLNNYIELFSSADFLQILYNTVYYTGFGVLIKFIIGLASALVLNQPRRFNNIYRTILFIPWAVPTVIASLVWLWVYDEFNGLLNILLIRLGLLDHGVAWLAEPKYAMWAVIAVVVWNGTPFYTMHFLAGLQAIPKELYEAAEIDGAGQIRKFWHITVPSMSTVFTITVMLSTVFTSTSIVVVNIMTNGAPANLTQIIPNESFNVAIQASRMGLGSAVNMVLFPFLVVFIVILTRRLLRKDGG